MDRKTNNILSVMKRNIDEIKAMKSAQNSGSDNYVIYQTESSQIAYSASAGIVERAQVSFTANSMYNTFAELNARVFTTTANETTVFSIEPQKKMSLPNSLVTQWDVRIAYEAGSPPSTLYVIWYVLSLDTGVING